MSAPSVSILLPVRNACNTLGACLRSLRRQTIHSWECLLVDDGSDDGSRELALRTAANEPRLRVLENPGEGIVAALHCGLAAAKAPLIARMDADDVAHRQRLFLQAAAMADGTLDGVGCHVRLFPTRAVGPGMRAYGDWLTSLRRPEDLAANRWIECPLPHPTWMFRRRVLERTPWRETSGPEDYDLLLRLYAAGHRIGVVPRRLLAWRQGPHRLSMTSQHYCAQAFSKCKAEHLAATVLAGDDRYLLWGYGRTGRLLRAALAAHGKRPLFLIELHPGRLGQKIHGAPVVPPEDLVTLPDLPLLVSVAGAAARSSIRDAVTAAGRNAVFTA